MTASPPRPSSGARIRVGVAGLGAVAQAVHLPILAKLDDLFEIAALADLSASLRTRLGARYGVPEAALVGSVDELLAIPSLDAVVILTSGSHGAAALGALERGLAVLCEKPLATTLAEADRLTATGRSDRLLLGYMKTFDPAVEEARRIVAADGATLGELREIDVTVLHPTGEAQLAFARIAPAPADVDPAVLAQLHAESERLIAEAIGPDAAARFGRLYGGVILGSIVHELSVIRAVTGDGGPLEIDHVDVWPDGVWPPCVAIVGRQSTGARITIKWLFLDEYPAYREDVRFHHRGGSVELTFPAPYRLHEPTILRVETGGAETRRRIVFDSVEEAFEREIVAFAGLVRDGTPPSTSVADGRTDTITCQRMAAAWAARIGVPIGGEAASA